MRYRPAYFLWILVQLAACRSSSVPEPTFAVRDSAGIRIVESSAPAWNESQTWSVDSVPEFDLSGQVDDTIYRVGNPRLLDDGRLVFFNGGACEVRFYGKSGDRIASTGRCGKGPGEFEEYTALWPWRGDSIVLIDQLLRVTFLSSAGTLGPIAQLPTSDEMRMPFVWGTLDDGTFVLAGPADPTVRGGAGVEPSRFTVGLLQRLGGTPHIIGTYPGPIFEYAEFNGGIRRGFLAFSSSTQYTGGGSRAYVGLSDRYEIQVYGADGRLEQIVRRSFTPVEVQQRDIDWLMERRLAEVEGAENQRAVRQAFRDLQHADVMPAFGVPVWPGGAEGGPGMLADSEGNLWVFDHYRPGEYRNHWSVFSSDGIWLGPVSLPARLSPSEIGADEVVGRWTDDTGFVHIRRHRIIKP